MKSEKEFLESMWTTIDCKQESLYSETLIRERDAKMRKQSFLMRLLILISAAFIYTVNSLLLSGNTMSNVSVFVSLILLSAVYVFDKNSYKEDSYGY